MFSMSVISLLSTVEDKTLNFQHLVAYTSTELPLNL